jgi:hypothetical protein
VLLERLGTNEALTQATVAAIEDVDGSPYNWSVTAYGICALP